jgi:hypothetical protein
MNLPQRLMNLPQRLFNEVQILFNEVQILFNEVQRLFNEVQRLIPRSHALRGNAFLEASASKVKGGRASKPVLPGGA